MAALESLKIPVEFHFLADGVPVASVRNRKRLKVHIMTTRQSILLYETIEALLSKFEEENKGKSCGNCKHFCPRMRLPSLRKFKKKDLEFSHWCSKLETGTSADEIMCGGDQWEKK